MSKNKLTKEKVRGICKRVLVIALCFAFILNPLVMNYLFDKVYAADSEERIQHFIDLMANKDSVSVDDVNGMSLEELQFVGIFLSNFFVPFHTDIGKGIAQETEKITEDFVRTISGVLGTNEEVALEVTLNVLGMMRETNKDLYYAFSKIGSSNLDSVCKTGFSVDKQGGLATYADLLSGMFCTDGGKRFTGLDDPMYMVFYFDNNGVNQPVFVIDLRTSVTPSEVAFWNALSKADIDKGNGWSIIDFTKGDEVEGADALKQFEEGLGDEDLTMESLAHMTIFQSKLAIDCFGNIQYKGPNHQYIALPGAMNPFTWEGTKGRVAGTSFNIINAHSLVGLYDNPIVDASTIDDSRSNYKLVYPMLSSQFVGALPDLKIIKGSSATSVGSKELALELEKIWDNDAFYSKYLSVSSSSKFLFFGSDSTTVKSNADIMNSIGMYGGTLAGSSEQAQFFEMLEKDDGFKSGYKFTTSAVLVATNDFVSGSQSYWAPTIKEGYLVYSNDGKYYVRFLGSNFQRAAVKGNYFKMTTDSSVTELQSSLDNEDFSLVQGLGDAFEDTPTKDYTYFDGTYRFAEEGKTVSTSDDMLKLMSTADVSDAEAAKMGMYDSWILIDNLGSYGWEDPSKSIDYKAVNVLGLFESTSINDSSFKSEDISELNSEYTSMYDNLLNNTPVNLTSASAKFAVRLFMTYFYAANYDTYVKNGNKEVEKIQFKLASSSLPAPKEGKLKLSANYVEDKMIKDIKGWVYYLLHPEEGTEYVRQLIKTKATGVMVGWHEDMVGTRGSGVTMGTTHYNGSVGYTTMPTTRELPLLNTLFQFYYNIEAILIILVIVMGALTLVLGMAEWHRIFAGVLVSILVIVFIPNLFMQGIAVSNNMIGSMFKGSFNSWALIQNQAYNSLLTQAENSQKYESYLSIINSMEGNLAENQGTGDAIQVYWLAPKKMAALVLGDKVASESKAMPFIQKAINRAYSGESYTQGENGAVLYRSYLDLGNFSRYMYGSSILKGSYVIDYNSRSGLSSSLVSAYTATNQTYNISPSTISGTMAQDYVDGYINLKGGDTSEVYRAKIIFGATPYVDAIVSDAVKIYNLSQTDFVGIDPRLFQFGLPYYTSGSSTTSDGFKMGYADRTELYSDDSVRDLASAYKDDEIASLGLYGVMSESPYYYFAWKLYDDGLSYSGLNGGSSNGYKNLLLGQLNGGFFYNTKTAGQGVGEVKDYMDMRTLFTYVIPYLNMGNTIVRTWDNIYGIKIYEGASCEMKDFESFTSDDFSNPEMQELIYKTWHNINVSRLYSIYCPWVDQLYDASYAKPEKVRFMDKTVTIDNPLDPSTYPSDRPMIFSRSEMENRGYRYSDLTEVERRIIKVEEEGVKDLYKLLDFYTFSDNVLDNAAAMTMTFTFNRVFSTDTWYKDGVKLEPQSFEMNKFSYDAYLRMILAASTGESFVDVNNARDGFYSKVVERSSFTTAVFYLLSDICAIYIIPIARVVAILLVMFSIMTGMLLLAFKLHEGVGKVIIPYMILPLLWLFIPTILFGIVICVMAQGGVGKITVDSAVGLALGDPVIAMIAILIFSILYLMSLFKVLKMAWGNTKSSVGTLGTAVGGVLGTALGIEKLKKMAGLTENTIVEGSGVNPMQANSTVMAQANTSVASTPVVSSTNESTPLMSQSATTQSNIDTNAGLNQVNTGTVEDTINKGSSKVTGFPDRVVSNMADRSQRRHERRTHVARDFAKSERLEAKAEKAASRGDTEAQTRLMNEASALRERASTNQTAARERRDNIMDGWSQLKSDVRSGNSNKDE